MFEIWDTLIVQDQLLEGGSYSGGSDLNQKQKTKLGKNKLHISLEDLLNFGLKESTPVQYCVPSDNDTTHPPAKIAKISIDKMLEQRKTNMKTD